MERFTVIVDWEDSEDKDWAEADEIRVWAKSAAGATSKARAEWKRTKGAAWPRCVLTRVWVLTRERHRDLTGS
jgi:hypothetical protein